MEDVNDLENSMIVESKEREKILKEANNNLDSYSNKIIEYEAKIKECELLEIKYKNQQREIEELNNIYKTKSEQASEIIKKLEDEVNQLRRKALANNSKISNLKSVLTSIIAHAGMDYVIDASGVEKERIEKYLQEES